MKRTVLSVFMLAAMYSCAAPLFAEKRVFTEKSAVEYAYKNNHQIIVMDEEINVARSKVRETAAMGLPKIDFNFNYSQFETMTALILPESLGNVYYSNNIPSSNYAARLSLLQYLYAGGRFTSALKLAKTNHLIAEANKEIALARTKAEVRKSFYELAYLDFKLKSIEKEIREIENRSKKQDSDWLSELKRERIGLKAELYTARMHFLSLIGLELNTEFDIEAEIEPTFKSFELPKLLAWAHRTRPELNKGVIQETIDALSVSLLQKDKYPTITLGGTYELLDLHLNENKRNWAMYLNLNLPLFDGWASWARISALKAQSKQSTVKRANVEDQINLEVRSAFTSYNVSKEKAEFDSAVFEAALKTNDRKKIFLAKIKLTETKLLSILSLIELERAVGAELR